jgi:hypothetical protein
MEPTLGSAAAFNRKKVRIPLFGPRGCEMVNHSSSEFAIQRVVGVVASNDANTLDSVGEAILKLLHKGADAAEAHSRQVLETAQKLSSQLRAAEDRIAELETEVHHYREKSERAEEWLRKISVEIEDRLVSKPVERRQMLQRG